MIIQFKIFSSFYYYSLTIVIIINKWHFSVSKLRNLQVIFLLLIAL